MWKMLLRMPRVWAKRSRKSRRRRQGKTRRPKGRLGPPPAPLPTLQMTSRWWVLQQQAAATDNSGCSM
jgi:hypothetical protein